MGDALPVPLPGGLNRWLDDAVKRAIGEAVRNRLADPEFAFFHFIKHMQARLLRQDASLSSKASFAIAANTYHAFLADEKIEFGDPRFDWSKAGAETLIYEYEIANWEPRP